MKALIFLPLLMLCAAACVHMERVPFGSVDCDVQPDDCTIYVNGERVGIADDFDGWPGVLDIKPGTYDLEFRLEGYETYKTTAKVEAWETTKVEHTLSRVPPSVAQEEKVEENPENTGETPSREMGKLSLRVTPENAVIYLNNKILVTGEDLARLHGPLQIEAGKHIINCYAPGYKEDTREFALEPGEYLELDIVLVKQ